MKRFFDGFPSDAHPMPVLSSAVSALSTFYQDFLDPFDEDDVELSTVPAAGQAADDRGLRLQEERRPAVPLPGQLARPGRELPADDVRLPGRAVRGRPGAWPAPSTGCSSCTPTTSRTARRRPSGSSARRRPTCSPRSRPASTRCSGRCTAAPTSRCSRCSSRSATTAATSPAFVKKVKNKEDGVKLMGFGHRVYKNYDPRAAIVKKSADEVLVGAGQARPPARHRHRARAGTPSRTTTSSSASSTRTSTSTPG